MPASRSDSSIVDVGLSPNAVQFGVTSDALLRSARILTASVSESNPGVPIRSRAVWPGADSLAPSSPPSRIGEGRGRRAVLVTAGRLVDGSSILRENRGARRAA